MRYLRLPGAGFVAVLIGLTAHRALLNSIILLVLSHNVLPRRFRLEIRQRVCRAYGKDHLTAENAEEERGNGFSIRSPVPPLFLARRSRRSRRLKSLLCFLCVICGKKD